MGPVIDNAKILFFIYKFYTKSILVIFNNIFQWDLPTTI
jgi:hypothetical protein